MDDIEAQTKKKEAVMGVKRVGRNAGVQRENNELATITNLK